jgi:hypothetical protein
MTLQAQALKAALRLDGQVGGRGAFARELVNADLDEVDELRDEWAELNQQRAELAERIEGTVGAENAEARRRLRGESRDLARQLRAIDTRMLGLYITDEEGGRFDAEVLAGVPVRVQTALIKQATDKIYGADEGPTPGANGTG